MPLRFDRVFALAAIALLPVAASVPAAAQEPAPPAEIGRVSYVSGALAFTSSAATGWTAARLNYPVGAGAWLWTDPHARAEIRVGPDAVAMTDDTELNVVTLNRQALQFGVPQGRIEVHLRTLAAGETAEIDLPRGSVSLLQPGIYDIAAGTAESPAKVTVFDGSARFTGGGADLTIKAGNTALLSGTQAVAATVQPAARDAFAEWCRSRAYNPARLAAAYYLSPWMTGYADLDAYGHWATGGNYGEVWYPNTVPASWVPYQDGRWISMPGYGWSWVDAEPWGFAPFHYGRWARIDGRWGWVPGRFEAQPVYAPALVAFLDVGASPHGPAVGWFPLAPGEPYYPSYTRDPAYLRRINAGAVPDDRKLEFGPQGGPPAEVARHEFGNHQFATIVPQHVFANAGLAAAAALAVAAPALQRATATMRPPGLQAVPTVIHPAGPVAPLHPVRPASAAAANDHAAPSGPHEAHPPGAAIAPLPPGAGPHRENVPVPPGEHPTSGAAVPRPPGVVGPHHEAGPEHGDERSPPLIAGPHHEAGPEHREERPGPAAIAPVPPVPSASAGAHHETEPARHEERRPAPPAAVEHGAGPREVAPPAASAVSHPPLLGNHRVEAAPHAPPPALSRPHAPQPLPTVIRAPPHPPAAPHIQVPHPPARPMSPPSSVPHRAAPPAPHAAGKGSEHDEHH